MFLEVKVVAERSLIQTAAILICLTGKRGDNLPLQLHAPGEEGGKRGRKQQEREKESKGLRAEQNSDKGLYREKRKKK